MDAACCVVSIRHFFNKEGDFNNLTAAAFHKPTHILVTGFASGIFHLHELPEFNLIHSLRSGVTHTHTNSLTVEPLNDQFHSGPKPAVLARGVIHQVVRTIRFCCIISSNNSLYVFMCSQYLRPEDCHSVNEQLWRLDRLWLLRYVLMVSQLTYPNSTSKLAVFNKGTRYHQLPV